MRFRKLLNWRSLLIYSHRWLGIVVGVLFIIWCLSGIVLMYATVPHLKAGERLVRMRELDLSGVRVTPAEAVASLGVDGEPTPRRIGVVGDRPIYRVNFGRGFGSWEAVYADTGEKLDDFGPEAALAYMRDFIPEAADQLRYEAFMPGPDEFTRIPGMQVYMPLHRIALDDGDGTEYYVSGRTGEAVNKATFTDRVLGISGYTLHTLFFFRQQRWWSPMLHYLSWTVLMMTLTGAVVGVWRYGLSASFRQGGGYSHSPYRGWMKWHHYAGLIVGVAALTWMFSGLVSLAAIPGIGETTYSADQMAAGADTLQGTGADMHLGRLTIDGMRAAAAAVRESFPPKELELLEFNERSYYMSYRPPTPAELATWTTYGGLDFVSPTLDKPHLIVSALEPGAGTFERFDTESVMDAARAAMPGVEIEDATWIDEFDSYYYNTLKSFDTGLMKTAKTLPALRVKYADPNRTWLYITPTHGQIIKAERLDRRNRWAYYGLHGLDFAFLMNRRPLWDIVAVGLLLGTGLIGVTSVVPSYRRLKRHALRLFGWRVRPRQRAAPAAVGSHRFGATPAGGQEGSSDSTRR